MPPTPFPLSPFASFAALTTLPTLSTFSTTAAVALQAVVEIGLPYLAPMLRWHTRRTVLVTAVARVSRVVVWHVVARCGTLWHVVARRAGGVATGTMIDREDRMIEPGSFPTAGGVA